MAIRIPQRRIAFTGGAAAFGVALCLAAAALTTGGPAPRLAAEVRASGDPRGYDPLVAARASGSTREREPGSEATAKLTRDVPFGTGEWDPESGLGNHRAVVRVLEKADAVRVRIPWRRPDSEPHRKGLVVVDESTGSRIVNIFGLEINREFGDVVFEAPSGPADYFVYYMPYQSEGRKNYPQVRYREPGGTDPGWLARNGLGWGRPGDIGEDVFPWAETLEIQSIDAFNSFDPMEVIATSAEKTGLLAAHPEAAYLVFPEDRRHPIRMAEDIPLRWVSLGPRTSFRGEASRGEHFALQIGVWAARRDLQNLRVTFSDFLPADGETVESAGAIPAADATCYNTEGVNWDGQAFRKNIRVDRDRVQALWCGLSIPVDAAPGNYSGTATISADGLPSTDIRIDITVGGDILPDAGDFDPLRHSRLRWLNSRIAFDHGVVPPFTPVEVRGRSVRILGRTLVVGDTGLPEKIRSFFTPEVTVIGRTAREFLSGPVSFVVRDAIGLPLAWKTGRVRFSSKSAGAAAWQASNRVGDLTVDVEARMEFDGFVAFKVSVRAEKDMTVDDIRLEIPIARDAARYIMGLGHKGGLLTETLSWTWDQSRNQDALWIGDVNAGVQVQLRAENYRRPLNTNFYLSQPLNLPPSWWNGGKGWVAVRPTSATTIVCAASSGRRTLAAGETLHFDFHLLLTPFKPLDTDGQWRTRFFHAFEPLDAVGAAGANTINVHHANAVNPYINYPFLRVEEMKAYIDEARRRGFKVKIYNTIRELSNRAPELFALRSLGGEIFSPGPGGGYSWLQEHLRSDYIAAWFVPDLKDAAVINSGMSRWHNYYLEGLDWLTKNIGIDGLYIDDLAFDRTTMKRARKILSRNRPGSLIDLHSANQYNERDGFASSANLYMEHFPYIDRLWFGEYFDYGSAPDYWLVELSGIPFGLMGEMLQDGGNPWRGMIYGMTSRLPWAGDPRPLWKAWDDFGMPGTEMIGYWSPNCPVRTDHPAVPATVYLKKGRALVALAGWADEPVSCRLTADWKRLGIDPATAVFRAPAIEGFQDPAEFGADEAVPLEPGKGWLLIIESKKGGGR